jgi:hypothetical protein
VLEPEYFERKRRELGLDREDILGQIQRTLDEWYPGQARARQLHQGVLRIATPNASVASELRLRQMELLARHSAEAAAHKVERLQISIQSLDR